MDVECYVVSLKIRSMHNETKAKHTTHRDHVNFTVAYELIGDTREVSAEDEE